MRNWKTYLAALVAGCVLFAAAVANARAQRGGKFYANDGPASNAPGDKPTAKVQAVDPTPEQREKIGKLIAQLGASTARERDRAMSELAEFGAAAIKQVEAAVDHDDDEIGHRCVILLEVLHSGQAELFLAARRLGLTIRELQEKLAAPDPSALLQTLEQNAGAGMAPVWARVISSLATMPQRFPAAMACRRAEGLDGYGAVLVKAARDAETRKHPARCAGLISLVAFLPPQSAQDCAVALAALTACDSRSDRLALVDAALRQARALRGLYESKACFDALSQDNERLLAFNDCPGQVRLLAAMAMALAPSATENQVRAARMASPASMNSHELQEFSALCARGKLAGLLEKELSAALAAPMDESRAATLAAALALCGESAFNVFDALPPAAKLAALDAWWFSPPPAARLQPFLIARLSDKSPLVRGACAGLLRGYRAPSTCRALAQCALSFADTAPAVLEALAPMADLLPAADSDALKRLAALLDGAELRLRPALIDTLLASKDAAVHKVLDTRWRTQLPMNELSRAMRFYGEFSHGAAGAYCASRALLAASRDVGQDYYLRLHLAPSDRQVLRALLACDDTAGFALLAGLAGDAYAAGSAEALLALAWAGKDKELAADIARKRAAGNDPRGAGLSLFLAISQTPEGIEFREQALQRGGENPEVPFLISAVFLGRAGKLTRDDVLDKLCSNPANLLRLVPMRMFASAPLPDKVARAIATTILFDGDSGSGSIDFNVVMLLRMSGVDVIDVLFGSQAAPTPRTPLQIAATAILGRHAAAREILQRVEPSKDGRDYELREVARAYVGITAPPLAQKILNAQAWPWRPLCLERDAAAGDAAALRELLDGFSKRASWRDADGFASVSSGSRFRGDGSSQSGAAYTYYVAPALNDDAVVVPALIENLLGERPQGSFEQWWISRRGLVEMDPATKKLKLVALK